MKGLVLVSILFAGATLSQAAVLVDQDPNTGPYGGQWGDQTGSQLIADSFTLTHNATITEYDAWGVSPLANKYTYTLVLYADSGSNTPGKVLTTLDSLTPSSFGKWGLYGPVESPFTAYEAVFKGLSISVDAGTEYWIGVSGDSSDASTFSTNPSSNGDGYLSFTKSGFWNTIPDDGDMTYELKGAVVPEPFTMAFCAAGLGLAFRRLRRGK